MDDAGILWFVLDEQSRERLRQAAPPLYQNEYYHHVTLQYGVGREEVASFIGRSRTIKVYAIAYDEHSQACRVDTGDLPDTYGVPHITLSTAIGVKPFASVAMLRGEHSEHKIEYLEITGTIAFEYIKNVKD